VHDDRLLLAGLEAVLGGVEDLDANDPTSTV